MKRLGKALLTGILLAFAGGLLFITPYAQQLEEQYGLALLFKLRGPRPPPEKAVVVNIDGASPNAKGAYTIGASNDFRKWPRTVFARLVDRLTSYGASVIVFDVHFVEHKNKSHDQLFAEAIRRAGNVILAEQLQHTTVAPPQSSELSGNIEVEVLVPPADMLADAALALAPFPLPKIPVRVTRTWCFKPSCAEVPTLPAVAFQAVALSQYNQLYQLLHHVQPGGVDKLPATAEQMKAHHGLSESMQRLRAMFLEHPGLEEKLLASRSAGVLPAQVDSERQKLTALIKMYGRKSGVTIDFYGPPFSITTISCLDVLASRHDTAKSLAKKIRGNAVFVGVARNTWSKQKDGFYTVFSQPEGLDISGVELAATVFSNIAENRVVQQVSPASAMAIIFLSAVGASLVSFFLPPLGAVFVLLSGGIVGIAFFGTAFSLAGIWPPLILPLLVLPPVTFVVVTLVNYLGAQRRHHHMSTALSYYVPENVVEELTRDLSFISKGDGRTYSTCLITDAQNYTTLSESLTPEELSSHMKKYYQCLIGEVKKMNGVVCNIIGDSMLAHWPSRQPQTEIATRVCRAALNITGAVAGFNQENPGGSLPTRIGLHAGYLMMDNIGAVDHFEYGPVGDIVNTVSRIEGLNKRLGTRILASDQVVAWTIDLRWRKIGCFLLGGKTQPVTLHQLLDTEQASAGRGRRDDEVFSAGLAAFQAGEWQQALEAFTLCLTLCDDDGPSLFYKRLCEFYLVTPPSDWQGVVQVDK